MFWHVSVCLSTGGVPVSHNALQHFPECHGAAGGVPVSHNALHYFPECHEAAVGGGVPCQVQPGGYPGWGGTLAGGYPGRGGTLARRGTLAGGYPGWGGTQLGQHREYLLHGGRYASCVHAGGFSCYACLCEKALTHSVTATRTAINTAKAAFAFYLISMLYEINNIFSVYRWFLITQILLVLVSRHLDSSKISHFTFSRQMKIAMFQGICRWSNYYCMNWSICKLVKLNHSL